MTTKEELLKKHKEAKDHHTHQVILWLQNDEGLYLGSKTIKTPARLAVFWRYNKPRNSGVNVRYVDWKEVFRMIKEE